MESDIADDRIHILPNVKDEPRPWLARLVLLGARGVTAMVVGSGALLARFLIQQIKNIGANLRRIGIPTLFPMAIELPRNSGAPIPLLSAPHSNRCMRFG